MTVPPKINLAESAMPWARNHQEQRVAIRKLLEAESNNSDSAGSQLRSKIDNMAQSISQIQASNLTLIAVGGMSGTITGPGWSDVLLNVTFNLSPRSTGMIRAFINVSSPSIPPFTIGGSQYLLASVNGAPPRLEPVSKPPSDQLPPGVISGDFSFVCTGPPAPGGVNTIALRLGDSVSASKFVELTDISVIIMVGEA